MLSDRILIGLNHVDIASQHNGVYYVVLRDDEGGVVYCSKVVKTR